jgi:acyl-CoA reductase-like NAD-dependent aldehyde dehydrogenase
MKTKTKKRTNGGSIIPVAAPLAKIVSKPTNPTRTRLTVNRAYKMYVGGAFIRSESGRYFQVKTSGIVKGADPDVLNMPRGSRKDVRDAVLAAKNAEHGWASRTAFNRGQILYRLAEMMESRRDELATSLERGGLAREEAASEVDASIDRCVYYAGFADKFHALVASSNPVAGPHFGFSVPEPMGVVGVIAPSRPSLLGLVSTVLPVICGGNTCVALASESDPRTALVWTECVATSDMPSGVVNVLTGHPKEIAPNLARHREVIAIEAWLSDQKLRASLEQDGADNVKRVKTHDEAQARWDGRAGEGVSRIERFLETKTVWHPVGI